MTGPTAAATFDRVEDGEAVFLVYAGGEQVATVERPTDDVPDDYEVGDRFRVHAADPAAATLDDFEFDAEKTDRFGGG